MRAFFWGIFLLIAVLNAEEISTAKYAKLVAKGKNIAKKLCDKKKLALIQNTTLEQIIKQIDTTQPCIALNGRNKEALAYFLQAGTLKTFSKDRKKIIVPKTAKCPVCGMIITKYPKWAARMTEGSHTHYFDGVKDMMKFYIFDADFPYDRDKIRDMEVTDFYTLKAIDAKKAFYVIGSDVFGPMGEELIPFLTKDAAKNFSRDHQGKKIILFDAITPKLVMGLDGIEYNE
ncbi:nosL-related protein [hydrothermal vent metagenome]|uniref:NosL-related protein n=1 Tax=hydrothermal vent metagenome TaxID=652676 RepID=A0A1W1CDH3_9ZZZZ